MEVVAHVRSCLQRWSEGGESECLSLLVATHTQQNSSAIDSLANSYQVLVHCVLQRFSSSFPVRLDPDALVAFIKKVMDSLPSTSTAGPERPYELVRFGELFVDLIWAIDGELDDVIADMKGLLDKKGDAAQSSSEKAQDAQKVAETDKATLALLVRRLLSLNVLDAACCRERLETHLLGAAGLIHDKTNFEKREIRTRTGIFYKQNKFNLLREQSEGYTKLTTDLIGNLGPPNDPATARPVESFVEVQQRAQVAWKRVTGLIGSFDLDPNRCLDVILDVFSVNIATHWHFFLALLANSPWKGNSRQMDWNKLMFSASDKEPGVFRGKSLNEILQIAKIRSAEELSSSTVESASKPKVLAQVLGFKFRHYQSPETKLPCTRGLYLVAALLIREGFIDFEDLYPHLTPADEVMSDLHQKYLDDIKDRIKSSANNLLAMAAPLESGASARPKVPTEEKPVAETKEAPAQKAMIVVALLSVGAFQPAIALLAQYQWLVDVQKDIADLLLRMLKVSIEPLYEKQFSKERNRGFLQPRSRYASPGIITTPTRKSQLTLCAPPPPSTQSHDCIFFYPQWSTTVPICQSLDDIVDVVEPLMRLVGVHVARDPLFLTKFLRLGKVHLAQSISNESQDSQGKAKRNAAPISEPENPTQEFWLAVSRRHLLPALSMMPGNAVCTVEVWSILKHYEMTIRWRLYGEWRDACYKSHPELDMQRVLREREAKGILRRLASQTVDALAGKVAKMAHTNPCLFFTNAVNQIQAYENMADVVIQALKYATNMGFDVLVFIVIDALANPHKERMKEDGANASDWLQSLATFTGALFRRYATDLSSVLKYIVHQLYASQTSEIIVLEKLILKMAGIEPLPSLSDAQITAMAGGPALRIEAVASNLRGAALDASEVSYKGTHRLGRTLIDTKLALPILVQISQQRQACVFKARDAHLKSIASLYDATHGVLFQYLDLLSSSAAVPLEDYRAMLPPITELVTSYGMTPAIAMQVLRPMLNEAIAKRAVAWDNENKEQAEKRLRAALAAKKDPTSAAPAMEVDDVEQVKPSSSVEGKMDVDTSETIPDIKQEDTADDKDLRESPWIPELADLFEECKAILPGNAAAVLGSAFYLTFWQLSSYDLYYPKQKYLETEKHLLSQAELFYNKAKQAEKSMDKLIRASSSALRAQKDRYQSVAVELKKERQLQEIVHRFTTDVDGRLEKEKCHWFPHVGTGSVNPAIFTQAFIEHCLLPRSLLSPMDAVFCSKFIRTLHERGTPKFHSLQCYNKLLGEHLKVVIFSCSENEARNYGRFLKGVLQDLNAWATDQKVYDASNSSKTKQGATVVHPGFQSSFKSGPLSPEQILKWQEFKIFVKKCHRRIGEAVTECLKTGDFMRVYNAILVLKEIIEVFPLMSINDAAGSLVYLEIEKVVQTEERGDLKILARAYASSLKKREKLWAVPVKLMPAAKPALRSAVSSTKANVSESSRSSPAPVTGSKLSQPSLPAIPDKEPPIERPNSTSRLDLESIPRPEVVKRIKDPRPDTTTSAVDTAKAPVQRQGSSVPGDSRPSSPMPAPGGSLNGSSSSHFALDSDSRTLPLSSAKSAPSRIMSTASAGDLRKEVLQKQEANGASRPATPQPSVQISKMETSRKEMLPSSPRARDGDSPLMAPPSEPSQTASAQELRSSRRGERNRDNGIERPSRSRRSESPSTRPGTRSASADSRASTGSKRGRSRRDRAETDGEESRRSSHADAPSRAERSHRESRSERRDRIPGSSTRDTDRERDSERRERDKPRDRDRERDKRERSERESHRDRDRDREREKDRHREDRHRRDEREREKERDRERKSSGPGKESDGTGTSSLPARSDDSRGRAPSGDAHPDDMLGKRRRAADDDSERSAKRASRHREHRGSERSKDTARDGDKDTERRRKDREVLGPENPPQLFTKELPDRPRADVNDQAAPSTPIPSTPRLNPPSGPRAMAPAPTRPVRGDMSPIIPSSREPPPSEKDRDSERPRSDKMSRDLDRNVRDARPERSTRAERDREDRERVEKRDRTSKEDRGWKSTREAENSQKAAQTVAPLSPAVSSLADRISAAPDAPAGPNRYVGSAARDEPSDRLKRTNSDRDKLSDPPISGGSLSSPKVPQKKARIDRSRLGLAHRHLRPS